MIRIFLAIAIVIGLTGTASAEQLTEHDVVTKALRDNKDLAYSRIKLHIDSLNVSNAESDALPQASLKLTGSVTPYDSTQRIIDDTSILGTSQKNRTVEGDLTISQTIPGGGKVIAGLHPKRSLHLSNDSLHWGTGYSVGFSQPLARGAFKHADPGYSIRIARIDNEALTLEQKKAILQKLSVIRSLFWDYYERKLLFSVIDDELKYTRKQREVASKRFEIGQATVLDTLSAFHQELQTQRKMVSAQAELIQARSELASALMMDTDSLEIKDSIDITIADLPPPDTLLARIETYHPQEQFFKLLQEKLEIEHSHAKNALLPSLTAGITYNGNRNEETFFSRDHIRNDNLVLSLILSYDLPLTRHSNAIAASRLNLEKNRIDQKEYDITIRNRIETLRRNWEQEKLKLRISETSVDIARRKFESAQQGYSLGMADYLELLKAQNDLTVAQIENIQGQITMKRLEITMEQITGTVLHRFGITIQ